ncbi:MAG: hypothetical protein M3P92_02700, partial [Actinomycetota bacterium]|nr:hypothetical protein [Actinomycetota bacterium]
MSNGEVVESESRYRRSGGGGRPLARSLGNALEGGSKIASARKTLFVELLGGLGDALISLQAIQALARSYPEARLTVLTFEPGGELLENDPLIHEVV